MSIKVGVRLRPFNQLELKKGCQNVIQMIENTTKITNFEKLKHEDEAKDAIKTYTFDYSFWSHDNYITQENGELIPNQDSINGNIYSDQQKVFQEVGIEVLKNSFQGYHCSLFAYGQTGSGKSYSMIGDEKNPGVVPRICQQIFQTIKENKTNQQVEYQLMFSMLEIYNEKIQDLLVDIKSRPSAGLKVRQHKNLGIYVDGLSKHPIESYQEINDKMEEGNKTKTIASTLMNSHSSRAHTIITIEFKQIEMIDNKKTEKLSIINLVDLAGSEKISKTGATGDRLKEGCSINKSLHVLGLVISTLAEKSIGKHKNFVIPYRDSALTRILQNALGGNSKTVMICALSPADYNYEETLSTLRYADQAKKIKCHAIVNESDHNKLIRELKNENEKLKEQLTTFSNSNLVISNIDSQQFQQKIEKLEEELKQNQQLLNYFDEDWYKLKVLQQKQQKTENEEKEIDNKEHAYLQNLSSDYLLNGKIKYYLKKDAILIGRESSEQDQQIDIMLGSIGIQPVHAIITKENDQINIEPFNELCIDYLFVNGVKVSEPTTLSNNDRIIFGTSVIFLFKLPQTINDSIKNIENSENETWEFAQNEYLLACAKYRESETTGKAVEIQHKIEEIEQNFQQEKQQMEKAFNDQQQNYQNEIKILKTKIEKNTLAQKVKNQKQIAEVG